MEIDCKISDSRNLLIVIYWVIFQKSVIRAVKGGLLTLGMLYGEVLYSNLMCHTNYMYRLRFRVCYKLQRPSQKHGKQRRTDNKQYRQQSVSKLLNLRNGSAPPR